MPPPYFHLGGTVEIVESVPGFKTPDAAHDLDWSEEVTIPPGEYRIVEQGRNDDDWHDPEAGDGYYYKISGTTTEGSKRLSAWIRQNFLFEGLAE